MINIYQDERGFNYIAEPFFHQFACKVKSLVNDQRKALRTGDKKQIADCKKRERALLDWVSQYEGFREGVVKTKIS